MCGRCMKTCPWNLEGLFSEAPFRWAAMNIPKAAPLLSKLDDAVGNGGLNKVKKWWWDLEIVDRKVTVPTDTNQRDLKKDRSARKQRLAMFPIDTLPDGDARTAVPVDRKLGAERYEIGLAENAARRGKLGDAAK